MKKKYTCIASALIALLLLAGCGGGGKTVAAAPMEPVSAPAAVAPAGGAWDAKTESTAGWDTVWEEEVGAEEPMQPEPVADDSNEGGESSVYRDSGAKLIRRAELYIQTEQFDDSVRLLENLTAQYNGYFEVSSVYGGSYRDVNARRSGEYVVRIPAEHYSTFLNAAGDLGYLTNKSETSEDVGEQYYDTEARLKTQRTKQERLLSMLEKAETMEEIIALETALCEVEYQIELYSSTLKRYDSLIGYSTINISLDEVKQVTQEVGERDSLGDRMAAGLSASLRNLIRNSQELLIWLSYNLFELIILGAVVVAVVVVIRRIRGKKNRKQLLSNEKKEDNP